MAIISLHNFAHATRAQLSWHVQNFVVITSVPVREQSQISIQFDLSMVKKSNRPLVEVYCILHVLPVSVSSRSNFHALWHCPTGTIIVWKLPFVFLEFFSMFSSMIPEQFSMFSSMIPEQIVNISSILSLRSIQLSVQTCFFRYFPLQTASHERERHATDMCYCMLFILMMYGCPWNWLGVGLHRSPTGNSQTAAHDAGESGIGITPLICGPHQEGDHSVTQAPMKRIKNLTKLK